MSVEPLFVRDGERYLPTAHTRGPWSDEQQHGGAPAALLADLVAAAPGADRMAVRRLTYEFLGPVGLVPLRAEVALVRDGRRLQLLEGALRDDDERVLLRVHAVRLRRGAVALPGDAGPGPAPAPGPAASRPAAAMDDRPGFQPTGVELRWAQGSFEEAGPAQAWFRLARPLVDGETPSPAARVAAAADFGNGISRLLDFRTHFFINTDLSIHLEREPRGEWVLVAARTRLDPSGAGVASSVLSDEDGPIGVAAQTLFVDVR